MLVPLLTATCFVEFRAWNQRKRGVEQTYHGANSFGIPILSFITWWSCLRCIYLDDQADPYRTVLYKYKVFSLIFAIYKDS